MKRKRESKNREKAMMAVMVIRELAHKAGMTPAEYARMYSAKRTSNGKAGAANSKEAR